MRLQRLFTTIFTDVRNRPLRFRSETIGWRPDRLELVHRAPRVVVREVRCVLECHAWVSELYVEEAEEEMDLFLWSLQDLRPPGHGTPWSSLTDCTVSSDSIGFKFDTAWPSELEPDRTAVEDEKIASAHGQSGMLPSLPVFVEIGADRPRVSHTVNLAQRHDESPLWETSVLPEKFADGRLPGDFKLRAGPGEPEGLVHLVQHYRLNEGERIQLIAAAGLSGESARSSLSLARSLRAVEESERAWRRYFAGVPQFSSSDPWLTAAYWYRWYGLRLNAVDMPDLPICSPRGPDTLGQDGRATETFAPFVTEGIGFFRNFVTYSAQAHLREVAWMHDPGLALGILDNLGKCQRGDGSFPGHNYSCRPSRDFYHADFATGISQLRRLHRIDFERYRRVFLRYHKYLTSRSVGYWTLVLDQNETGQEYMSRYQFASDAADRWEQFEVLGVDATTYANLLIRLLAETARDEDEKFEWEEYCGWDAYRALGAMYDDMFFCDRAVLWTGGHASPGGYSPARPATGFYPLLLQELWQRDDIPITAAQVKASVERWLLHPQEFWLPKGFPATAASDPTFSAEGEWKGERLSCPWSGRSWPMVNSHLVDAAANVARQAGDAALRIKTGEALMKAIKLMFHDGDPMRPNSYEHYNPITGMAALYRGYDDYMHSWVVDLIIRHAVGVQPGSDEIDPLPLDIDWIECRDIPHPRGRMHVRIERGQAPIVTIS